ncbi:MAG: ABC transporter ATP-binding protein [Tenericutes bacterium]|nr:ABC transporter ATP-binding protein [Mycoplasmatota bacterium]
MKQITKLLSKYFFEIILVVALLFIQAKCDLILPEYTSNIVNIGIQQSGIEYAVPEVIRENEFKKVLFFTDSEKLNIVKNNYMLIIKGDSKYLSKYPLLSSENLYILNSDDNLDYEILSNTMSLPLMIVSSLSKSDNILENQEFILDPNTDLSLILEYIDDETKLQIKNEIKEQTDSIEEKLINQAAIEYIKNEYSVIGYKTSDVQIKYILMVGTKMIFYTLIVVVLTIMVSFFSSRISSLFAKDLRSKVTKKVMEFSSREFKEMSTASLITRCTNDIQQIQQILLMFLRMIIYAPIIGIGAYMKISGSSMSWVIALAVALIVSLVVILFSITLPKFQKLQLKIDKINLVSREILSGLPVIRAFANEKYEEERFDNSNKDLIKTQLFVNRIMAIMMPTMMFIMNGVSILIIWVGASKVDAGVMQVGTLMAFITYTMQIIMAFLMLSFVSIALPRAIISMKRIAEVFNKKVSITQVDNPVFFDDIKGVVEFKDVYFRYPDADEDLIENVSFKALPGTTTAILGSTGSGKSTLINLIPRFFDVTGGKILIDGINIKDISLHDLRDKIGFVPQKGMLFSGTIESNIAFGKDNITEEELINSAKISQSYDFIKRKKDMFQSEISQGGTNVSGGQRQRLAIARAVAINPAIYIFDDSFSALDYKTDLKLRKELSKITQNSTIFIVAQRINTVLNADQIIVLDEGKVVGIGNHKELLENCEVYKEIAYSQLQKEELENE